MSYQQFIQSTFSKPFLNRSQSPTAPSYSIPRKPPANGSPTPRTPTTLQSSTRTQLDVRTPSLTDSAVRGPASPVGPITPTSSTSHQADGIVPLSVPAHTGTLSQQEVDAALRKCLAVLDDALHYHGKRPFSSLLLAPDASTVLLTHNSVSHVQHAESELARLASLQYAVKYLNRCTLVSTWEPCAMCAGTIYWSGIGRVLYAASETTLRELTGPDNEENMTMNMPCRSVFAAGQRSVEVVGPVAQWGDKVVKSSKAWWDAQRGFNSELDGFQFGLGGTKVAGAGSDSVTIVPDASSSGTIDDDGEYQADLKVDWMG